MLKQLNAVAKDSEARLPDEENEGAYNVWQEYNIKDELEAERKAHSVEPVSDIWPNWSQGRPSVFRRTYTWEPFPLGRVRHRWHTRTETLELGWQRRVNLFSIEKRPKALLPPDYSYAWSGVYRIFRPDSEIPRFLGQDPTGTLYIGKAGTKRNWSNLRTRVREAAFRTHHITRFWSYDDKLISLHPWESLYVEWAF